MTPPCRGAQSTLKSLTPGVPGTERMDKSMMTRALSLAVLILPCWDFHPSWDVGATTRGEATDSQRPRERPPGLTTSGSRRPNRRTGPRTIGPTNPAARTACRPEQAPALGRADEKG